MSFVGKFVLFWSVLYRRFNCILYKSTFGLSFVGRFVLFSECPLSEVSLYVAHCEFYAADEQFAKILGPRKFLAVQYYSVVCVTLPLSLAVVSGRSEALET